MGTIEVVTHFSDILRSELPEKTRAEYTETDPVTWVDISKEWLIENVPKIVKIPEEDVVEWIENATIDDTIPVIDAAISDYRRSEIRHPDIPDEYFLWHRDSFPYQMLARLEADCKYFINAGGYHDKHLWAGSIDGQIKKMKEIYNSFPDPDKPLWISMEDINRYESAMHAPEEFASRMEQIPGWKNISAQEAEARYSHILPNDFLYEEKACIACGKDDDYTVGWAHSEILLGYHIYMEEWDAALEALSNVGHNAINCNEKPEAEKKDIKTILLGIAPYKETRMTVREWAKTEVHNIYIRRNAAKQKKRKQGR